MRTTTVSACTLSLAFALAGCSGVSDENATATPIATATATADATTPVPAEPSSTVTVESTAVKTTKPAKATVAPAKIKVPNGVGLDYQSAQDLWRAAGLHVAPAVDAAGANRLPLIDANWVVVSQDLKAGSKVAAGSFITATVKKYTDS